MIEERRESRVPALEHPRRVLHRRLLGGIVMDVEVRRAQHLEVELLVLDFVASEVLRVRSRCGGEESACRDDEPDESGVSHGVNWVKRSWFHPLQHASARLPYRVERLSLGPAPTVIHMRNFPRATV